MNGITNTGQFSNKTATGTVHTGVGTLIGFFVNSTTAGTIILYDATSATNAVTGTITPAIGWHDLPLEFTTGLHVAIANVLNVTFIYRPR